jgi:hypothetical protein
MDHLVRLAMVGALFAAATACGGGSSVPATSAPPSSSSAVPTTPPEAAATPTALPRAPSLTSISDVPFPPDTEMLVLEGSDHGHSGWFHLKRYVRHGSGAVEVTDLLTPTDGATLTGVVRTASGRLLTSECAGMECVYEGGPKSVTTNFLSSTDGGATWSPVGSRAGEWWIDAADGEHALTYRTDSLDTTPQFMTVPDMATVMPPPGTGTFIAASSSRLLWSESNEPTLVDSANNVVAHFDLGAGNHAVGGYAAFGNQVAAVIREQRGADPAVTLVGRFAAGASTPTNLWLAPSGLSLGPWLNDHTIAVTTWYGMLNDATCGTARHSSTSPRAPSASSATRSPCRTASTWRAFNPSSGPAPLASRAQSSVLASQTAANAVSAIPCASASRCAWRSARRG